MSKRVEAFVKMSVFLVSSKADEKLLMDGGHEKARKGSAWVKYRGRSGREYGPKGGSREQRNMGHIDGLKDKSSLAG